MGRGRDVRNDRFLPSLILFDQAPGTSPGRQNVKEARFLPISSVVLHAIRNINRVFSSMALLQILAIVERLLRFAPRPEQKTIGFICPAKRATPH